MFVRAVSRTAAVCGRKMLTSAIRTGKTTNLMMTSSPLQQIRTVVTTSNSPTRVPQPIYDNAVIQRRDFKGRTIHLVPITYQHAPDLWVASGKGNKEMGEFLPGTFPISPLHFNCYIRDLANINDDNFSRGVAFCIQNMIERDLPIGVVSFTNISAINKRLDVGSIWIDKEFWGTHVNLETHYILMEEIFEFLKFNRVGFTVDCGDTRYQHFLEGMGAKKEGILRNYIINQESKPADAISYSIVESDWPSVKARVRAKIVEKLRDQTEKAKEKLQAEGLLEAYNEEQELSPKKVVKVKKEPKDLDKEDDYEEKRLFDGEEKEEKRSKIETKVKRRMASRKTK